MISLVWVFATAVALYLISLLFTLKIIISELRGIKETLLLLPVYMNRGVSIPKEVIESHLSPPTAGGVSIQFPSSMFPQE